MRLVEVCPKPMGEVDLGTRKVPLHMPSIHSQSGACLSLSRYLGYSVTKIRAQDTLSVIVYVSRNIQGRYLAWNFVRSKWPILREK